MNVKIYVVTLLLIGISQVMLSQNQEHTITGTIHDETGIVLPGVNITIAERESGGTTTDFEGHYELEVKQGETLKFSLVGFEDRTIPVADDNVINVTLKEGASLDEVVVTALGQSREKRSLGYSTQQIGTDKINETPTSDFSKALSGKISGLDVQQNTNFGGSTDMVIRGVSSITGNNNALYVIDGIPMGNRNDSGNVLENLGYDFGNPSADISSSNIESVNVLKGGAAAALYGSRAANGVIEITTKSGKHSKGIGVTINSGAEVGFLDRDTWVQSQKKYGAGTERITQGFKDIDFEGDDGKGLVQNFDELRPYGPAFDPDLMVYQWNAFDPESRYYNKKTPWVPAKHDTKYFFEKPITFTNSLSIGNKMEDGNYFISYNNRYENGSVPNSESVKNDFRMTGEYDVSKKLHISGSANYIKTKTKGRNNPGKTTFRLKQGFYPEVDMLELRDIYKRTGRNVTWNPSSTEPGALPVIANNPYWDAYENYEDDGRDRFLGRIQLDYDVLKWLNITARGGTDTYNTFINDRMAEGSIPQSFGQASGTATSGYEQRNISFYENNFDVIFNFNTSITNKIDFNGLLGANIRRDEYKSVTQSTAGGLKVPGVYSLSNSKDNPPLPEDALSKTGSNSFYGQASFGYENMVFLETTLRQDHFSTLPKEESKVWYPSISTSWVFSELLDNAGIVNFGKLKANYSEVGNGAPFDKIKESYVENSDLGYSVPNTHNNPDLKNERTKTYELGLEAEFFNNRISFDGTFYNSESIDQIIEAPVSVASGYYTNLLNAGRIDNYGFEIGVGLTPVKSTDWQWNIDVNWSKNKGKVKSLPEGINSLQLAEFNEGVTLEAVEGESFGQFRGTDYVYDDDGNRLIKEEDDPDKAAYGQYQETPESNHLIGNIQPNWLMGIYNSISWKDLTFSFLIDMKHGGSLYSQDNMLGDAFGWTSNTVGKNDKGNDVRLPRDEGGGFINPGVLPDGSENDRRVDASERRQFGAQGYPNSEFVYDASFIKLRELNLTYNLPERLLKDTFLEGVQFNLTGSNLWLIHKNTVGADPEVSAGSGNNKGWINGQLPSFRTYGFNVKLQF